MKLGFSVKESGVGGTVFVVPIARAGFEAVGKNDNRVVLSGCG